MASFINLRAHTAYSLSEGAIPVSTLVQKTKEMGMPAVAVTDTGNLFGALEFAITAKKEGIQPIIGCQVQITPPDSDPSNVTDTLIFLAKSAQGYRNLLKIVSHTYLEGVYQGIPQATLTLLQSHKWTEGLICLTGGPTQGRIGKELAAGHKEAAKSYLNTLIKLFPENLYIEISRQGHWDSSLEDQHIDLAYEFDVPLVATNEAFYPDPSMHEAHDALMCIAGGTYVNVPDRRRVSEDHYLKTSRQMDKLFGDLPEAIENTIQIARSCHFLLEPIDPILPAFPCASGHTEEEELEEQAKKGLDRCLETLVYHEGMSEDEKSKTRKTYFKQLDYELEVIKNMKFAGYFLIVADFIKWAKSQDIPVGPGRGSGAGSVVAWALTITGLDPIRFGLVFERFLNPERVSMPDFDIDFCQERRDEVIRYVQNKYGHDRVAHIITFGKLQARAVLRDVGRVLQMPYGQVDRICKLVPNNPANPVTLAEALEIEPQLQGMRRVEQEVDHLMNLALKLEGLYRHASTHAAGVVIGDRPLDEMVPLYHDPRSPLPATQFNMKFVEQAGLVKFDFLGLKTLTVIQQAINFIKNRGIALDIETIPLDDKATFDLLQRVETVGIFQIESGGMGEVVRKLRPDRLEEIIAVVALYRPGPMDNIPQYIARRHGEEEISYTYPELESILGETFGVIVYQEQVLQIARDLAGYTLGTADLLRRAMGKKIKSEMDAQRKCFVDGVVERIGGDEEKAAALFDQIEKFASYAFNKAHAAAYGLIAYQTAFLKAHYPVEFMAALMTLDTHNTDKLVVFTREVARMGISLLPPDVNESQALFKVQTNADGTQSIRYALAALKNVGQAAMESLADERASNGAYKDMFDFFERLDGKVLNKRLMENLVNSGALDSIEPNRRLIFDNLEILLKYATTQSSQKSLFETHETRPQLKEVDDWSPIEKLRREFEAIGFYLSGHPLDAYGDSLESAGIISYAKLVESLENGRGEGEHRLAGVVLGHQERTAKSGNRFAFVQFSDGSGDYEVTLFAETLLACREQLRPGSSFVVNLTADISDNGIRLTAQGLQDLNQCLSQLTETIEISIHSERQISNLHKLLEKCPSGRTQIKLKIDENNRYVTVPLMKSYILNAEVRSQLQVKG